MDADFRVASQLDWSLQTHVVFILFLSLFCIQLFLLSCYSTRLMKEVQYLDMSDNLLTDLTLGYMLCDGEETLPELRVLNISGNNLKVSVERSQKST